MANARGPGILLGGHANRPQRKLIRPAPAENVENAFRSLSLEIKSLCRPNFSDAVAKALRDL